jgi:hypothetical protein
VRKCPERRAVLDILFGKLHLARRKASAVPGGPAKLPSLVCEKLGERDVGKIGKVPKVVWVADKASGKGTNVQSLPPETTSADKGCAPSFLWDLRKAGARGTAGTCTRYKRIRNTGEDETTRVLDYQKKMFML